ncbi:MAG: hypothetical protein KDE31_28035 [Caldilineaceae bacterium]|nr:hypothetical protein [Caldilineaceae bacterium]
MFLLAEIASCFAVMMALNSLVVDDSLAVMLAVVLALVAAILFGAVLSTDAL